jgi:hypothetical protein
MSPINVIKLVVASRVKLIKYYVPAKISQACTGWIEPKVPNVGTLDQIPGLEKMKRGIHMVRDVPPLELTPAK